MTTVPGTYFTKEQLEAAVRVDRVWDPGFSGSGRMNALGYAYRVEKKQYEKALAWYILSVRENNGYAPVRIGILYFHGYSLPRNYLCALRWFLKGAKLNNLPTYFNEIGELFEYGFGVSLDKNMALDWYIHVGDKEHVDRLKSQGYRQSAAYKKKSFYQLKMETEAILDEEKKKLEAKQDKTQQEIEALVDLNITYKLTGGGKDAWTDVPILLASDKQRYIKPVNNSVTNTQNEILELKEKDNKINSLENENRTYHASSLTQIQTIEMLDHEIIIFGQNKIQSVIEMEQLKTSNASLEQLLKSKEDATTSLNGENKNLSTTNQLITGMVETQKVLLQAKANEMELLRQNMERQLADEKKRVEVLEQEIRALKQEMVQDQTHVQNTKHFNNNIINPANVESSLGASWW